MFSAHKNTDLSKLPELEIFAILFDAATNAVYTGGADGKVRTLLLVLLLPLVLLLLVLTLSPCKVYAWPQESMVPSRSQRPSAVMLGHTDAVAALVHQDPSLPPAACVDS